MIQIVAILTVLLDTTYRIDRKKPEQQESVEERMFRENEGDMEQEIAWERLPFDATAKQPDTALTQETQRIRAAQQGEIAAFNRLVLEYQDSVYRWALSLVNDDMLADDITQWTFITAYEKLSSFRGGSFRAWLFRIARNRSFDELRYRRSHASVSLDESPEDDRDPFEWLPDGRSLPEDELVASEQAEKIHRLLNSLPETFQQVLRLIDMEGMVYQEAADVLNLPLGTIKSRLARARLKMRDLIVEYQ